MAETIRHHYGVQDIEFTSGDKLSYRGDDMEQHLSDRQMLHKVLELTKRFGQVKDDRLTIEEDGIGVTFCPGLNERKSKVRETSYYKIEAGGQEYFLKKLTPQYGVEYGGGYEEFNSSKEAAKLLEDLDDVEVVNYKLGYETKEGWFFVSEWNPALEKTLEDYIKELNLASKGTDVSAGEAAVKQNVLMAKVKEIKKILQPGFEDVFTYNMAYNPETGKIIVFDLNKKKDEKIKI